jgi:fibro-slime domain-containing protein
MMRLTRASTLAVVVMAAAWNGCGLAFTGEGSALFDDPRDASASRTPIDAWVDGAAPPLPDGDAQIPRDVGSSEDAPRPLDDAAPLLCGTTLTGVVRDFQDTHPDFEKFMGVPDTGIVEPLLGSDGKPVYAGNPVTPSTTGKIDFDQWYRDVPGVNMTLPLSLTLAAGDAGTYAFDDEAFFPIDDQGFGNQGRIHNYHFTVEIHTRFIYRGGEVFLFRGDDDIFVFINGQLAINLGGVHDAESAQVVLDAEATALGMQPGGTYPLDLFFAERHTVESHIRIETTIGSFVDCGGAR